MVNTFLWVKLCFVHSFTSIIMIIAVFQKIVIPSIISPSVSRKGVGERGQFEWV